MVTGGCATSIGAVREVNQDAIMLRTIQQKGETLAVGIICDGIGGLEHGELASQTVIRAAEEWFDSISEWIDVVHAEAQIIFSHLKDAAEEWNTLVRELIESECIRTGTTMSAIMLLRNQYFIVHVGDSRIYRYRQELEQLTLDESIARACEGRMKLYLDNFLGKQDELSFMTYEGELEKGDLFLYGSDGFYHKLTQEDVEQLDIRPRKTDMNVLCEDMIQTMIHRGERDNISVGIIAYR